MVGQTIVKAFSPPPFQEAITEERIAAIRTMRLCLVAIDLGMIVYVLTSFRQSTVVDYDLMKIIMVFVAPLLALDGFLALFFMRRFHRHYRTLSVVAVLIETSAALVWVQGTGSVSTYYFSVFIAYILFIRLFVGYREAMLAFLVTLLGHTTMFILENAGILPPASLFVAGPGEIYSSSGYRTAGFVAIVGVYLFTFGGSNLIMVSLVSTNRALRAAEKDLVKVAKGAQKGRLTGVVLSDSYELRDLIGRGGMGEIYRARRLKDRSVCAIKVIHPHLVNEQTMVRFKREVEAAKRIPEKITPTILDHHFDDDSEQFLVMEFLQGEDLAALFRRRGKLPLDIVASLVDQIARALDKTHDAGIIHRDLKPHNVFIEQNTDTNKNVRLLDFGISKLDESDSTLTQSHVVLGSPGFMAPEQAIGDSADVGPEADIFGLGAIAYEAVTGERPFRAKQLAQAIHEILNLDPDPPSTRVEGLSQHIDSVVLRALAKDPQDRYQRATEFSRAFEKAITDTDSSSATPTIPEGETIVENGKQALFSVKDHSED